MPTAATRDPADPAGLVIAGIVPFSTVDWPGHLVATVFLQGCPWRCSYCHNPDLQEARAPGSHTWQEVLALLRSRSGMLDGVVLTGGEPTRQAAALEAVRWIRAAGFAVGLHTAGAYPARLAALLPHLDWVGLDMKASAGCYDRVAGAANAARRATASLTLVLQAAAAGLDYEVRTTVAPGMAEDTLELARELHAAGVRHYALQQARAEGTLHLREAHPPGWDEEFAALAEQVGALGFEKFTVR
ncbi:anaerobic ribonucleoside-triphosphate reductase activating protein [Serinibacter salmoneus]|uniref:Pyruvate formate lyase activating enzyme n=1 Tax=Serinibacter salmoneus TaxID=556530 RepID=A0A2A9D0R7_9MICO|nr:anaerobic ribonucleoside-triphosphate reductase activating protein [Serinibacter salmoneus]PFG19981.1 pyruvate formate lyase activating enzyme [Serinibacter salmoneus]